MKRRLLLISFVLFTVFSAKAQNDTVVFSARGGFYNEVFSLELYNTQPQNHIRYTTNGNRPTAQSPLYEEPLLLDSTKYSQSNIYTVVNCPEEEFFLPDSVQHCIVIRAAVFDENDSCVSQVMTNSYFIRDLGCDTHGLPAVSLCADSLDLFDYEIGIFVPGIHFDPLSPYLSGNYFMKGREWERLTNVEFYEIDNRGFKQQLGLRTHGKQSRWRSQKGYSLYAREEYGHKRINYKLFETTSIASFKRLALRPYMSAWNGSGCKDYICNRIVEPLDVESLSSRPCVLFINGEYWGIYYVEEKPDEHYLADHLGVDKDDVTIIKEWVETDCGDPANFDALYAWMEQADLSDDEQYAYAEAHIDISSFIDYFVFEIFVENLDWPAANLRCWQEGNGKWRWIFYDGDGCLEEQGFDAFANATYVGDAIWPSSRRATLFFRRLLENDQFETDFANRFNELAITTFAYPNTKPYFDTIKAALQYEVPNQTHRFGSPISYSSWLYYSMAVINNFLMDRPVSILASLNEFLSIEPLLINDFEIYPNPSFGEIHLRLDAEGLSAHEVGIFDMMGRKVFMMPCLLKEGRNEITFNPNLSPGVYIIKVGNHTQRIVKY
ncbi:MAG: CotH kinase family protein [Bacteroidales bacterium]|nr:CotH kinase family protein [Bacteroidales bacterium]